MVVLVSLWMGAHAATVSAVAHHDAGIASVGALTVSRLRTELMTDPLGIDQSIPRLSWVLSSRKNGEVQTAYRVEVASTEALLKKGEADLWDSGEVKSGQTFGVAYAGKPLTSRAAAYWRVWSFDSSGAPSKPSQIGHFEVGLTDTKDWSATWITDPAITSPLFEKSFDLPDSSVKGRVYVTARGLYRLYIDHKPIGKGLLTPGWTDFRKRAEYQTYDVTANLKKGHHVIDLQIADGWFSGHVGPGHNLYGAHPEALLQLESQGLDGTMTTVGTDSSWMAVQGPIVSSDLLMGENYDATVPNPLLHDEPGLAWQPVTTVPKGDDVLEAQHAPLVEQLMTVSAKKMTQPKPGVYIFDLGQNMVGHVRLKVSGPRGSTITLHHAEMLNKDGTIYTTNLRGAKATDTYKLAGGGEETYEPFFTFHGFRYVEVDGYPGVPTLGAVTGVVVGSACPPTGVFECSNELINKLQHNIVWGQRSNYLDVPTDCPQRDERLGWMGDAEAFIETACFNNDVDSFMTKWTQDVVDSQSPEGAFTDVSPKAYVGPEGAPAWGDAGVIVPWTVFENYGDRQLLRQRYPAMKRWVDFIDRNNGNHLWINHRGADFGDWLNVNDETPHELIATAYFGYSTSLVEKAAKVLGYDEDAKHYEALASDIRTAFQSKYRGPDGHLEGDSQTAYVLAIALGMDRTEGAADSDRLASLVHNKAHDHLSTGFLGVENLLPALDARHPDLAYKLLLTDTYPSWGYPIRQGATTIWERWDGFTDTKGFQDPGMNSFNHYALGSVGAWMYKNLGGISLRSVPGFTQPEIRPLVPADRSITWAHAKLETVAGDIDVTWHLRGDEFVLDLTTPPGSSLPFLALPWDGVSPVMIDGKPLKVTDEYSNGTLTPFITNGHHHIVMKACFYPSQPIPAK